MDMTSSASKTDFLEGTLAYKLLESAKAGENGTSYRETPLTAPSKSVSNVTYTETRASSETTKYAPAYFTYCDSFTQDVDTGYFIMENCNTTYYYDDPSKFVGKYTMTSQPTSKTETSISNKTSIFEITSASKTSVSYKKYTRSGSSGSYTYSTSSGSQNLKRNYIMYCDSYVYNQESGTYSLKDCTYGIYVDTYDKIEGKYSPVEYIKGSYGTSNNGSMHREEIYEITEANQDYYKIIELSSTKTSIEESNLITNEDDYGKTYYYRGAVKNNYLEYSDMCWRILRIQGNGTIKLILANEGLCSDKTTNSGLVKNGDSTLRAKFNTDTYNQTTGNDGNYLKSGSTTLKTKIESWYTDNISDKSRTTTTGFCNDDVIVGSYSFKYDNDYIEVAGNDISSRYYNFHRITEYQELPTFKCDDTLFEANVAPVTADELLFAGASYERDNKNFYINDEVSGMRYYEWWWTLTPCYIWKGTSTETAFVYYIYPNGTLRYGIVNDYGETSSSGSIRPVIVLKSNVLYKSGDGTSTNPYKIY